MVEVGGQGVDKVQMFPRPGMGRILVELSGQLVTCKLDYFSRGS
jgi:hypothetical protein